MEIKRDIYLNALIDRMHNGLIKVVTGIRRCGKSYLLFRLFRTYLLSRGVDEGHIITIEFDQRKYRPLRDADAFLAAVEGAITDDQEYYILLDEVQMLSDFEEVLNTLLHRPHVDIYVTGSNSRFLSTDIITEFRGRGDEIHVYPLSFSEFMQVYEGDVYHAWTDYVTYGGLPFIMTMKTEAQKIQYLTALFGEVYLRDIIERNHIERTQELEDLINILASGVGSLTNAAKIEATFKSISHSKLNQTTIRHYINCLEEAFMVSAAHRYDVKGRRYIGSPLKYYFEDTGLRNARLGFRQIEQPHLMENIVYLELRRRGFAVDVGVVPVRTRDREGAQSRHTLEIDFVANLGSRRYYLQSAFSIPDQAKYLQEKASLVSVGDSFKKIILVRDVMNVTRDDDGITTMSVYDFLLRPDSLTL